MQPEFLARKKDLILQVTILMRQEKIRESIIGKKKSEGFYEVRRKGKGIRRKVKGARRKATEQSEGVSRRFRDKPQSGMERTRDK